MIRALKNYLLRLHRKLHPEKEKTLLLLGQQRTEAILEKGKLDSLQEAEFRVFSQYGEDGIIQYLVNRMRLPKTFVEFGVENYLESNTRFLLINNNWKGIVMDSSRSNIRFIRKDPISWRHDITAVQAFITRENINRLLQEHIGDTQLGLLSIDIDGNDYWIWKAIDRVYPAIVVCEFNNVFGGRFAVTIPYDHAFRRRKAHHSDLYFGASLQALYDLAIDKGYVLAGINSAGMNAFFIRKDLADPFVNYSPEQIFVDSCIRESRDKKGRLNFLTGADRLLAIRDLPIYDTREERLMMVRERYRI